MDFYCLCVLIATVGRGIETQVLVSTRNKAMQN
jgi:hypothetical protein